jgi:porphobilinogen synthase
VGDRGLGSAAGDIPGVQRPRRLRTTAAVRDLAAETDLTVGRLIQPLFVVPGEGVRRPIGSLRGQDHLSVDRLPEVVEPLLEAGVGGVVLFGLPPAGAKDAVGTAALDPEGAVPRAVALLRARYPGLWIATDVCLDAYTDHGHCGIVEGERVLNDETLPRLAEMALVHARAGADAVAPSDMMDGRVEAIRRRLDGAGETETAILSYAVKYASSLYAPFREAEDSAPAFGDRRSYQMDPRNAREALREAALDMAEGADMLMVKPAGPYLDVLYRVSAMSDRPVFAYQVSGEYAMLVAAAEAGVIDYERALLESVVAIRRAGAQAILTYACLDLAALLGRGSGVPARLPATSR